MAKRSALSVWFHSLKPDGVGRNLLVTGAVAMFSAFMVSTAALLLQPVYQEQQLKLRQASMSNLIKKIPSLESILKDSGADAFESYVVNLDTGCYVKTIEPADFDARAAETDPLQSQNLSEKLGTDILLERRSNYEIVHLLYSDSELQLSILPVHGPGYQSTLYAWLVLAADLNTIVALNVYEHADTPGIGSRVENPDWQNSWQEKQLFDQAGSVAIRVVKNADDSIHEVDGISGATRTSMGVGNMIKFWVGEHGFGQYLNLLKTGKTC